MRVAPDDPSDPLESLERCCELMGPPTSEELERGLDGFLARVRPSKARRGWGWRRWSLVGAAATLLVLVALQVPSLRRLFDAPEAATLAYRIEGGSELVSGYLRESGSAGVQVLFSEGSRFELTPGARGRIRTVNKDGAHLAVERGTASLRIAPDNARRWLVDVGPFLVTVKGTVFTVSWDPSSEQFELNLSRGHVVVNSPVSAGEIALRAGQRLLVNLARSESVIREEPKTPAGQTAGGVSGASHPTDGQLASDSELPAPQEAPRTTSSRGAKPTDHRWREQLALGNWDRILGDVKRIGVNETLNRASSEDLFALANAARYHHQLDLARTALLAQRRRFPGSPRALGALYLLGRVDESRESGTAQAIAWYDEYLARAPAGPLVGEALGRKMILTEKLQGPVRARAVAEDYLRRFPKGNYAGSARDLLAVP
jgi:ferric-dicitrate binding protein FerR (iron transport regulator)